jgi:hypothetical protein
MKLIFKKWLYKLNFIFQEGNSGRPKLENITFHGRSVWFFVFHVSFSLILNSDSVTWATFPRHTPTVSLRWLTVHLEQILFVNRFSPWYIICHTLKVLTENRRRHPRKRAVSRWDCKNKRRTNSLCYLPDVLGIPDVKKIELGGLLLSSARYFSILTTTVSLSDLSISLG